MERVESRRALRLVAREHSRDCRASSLLDEFQMATQNSANECFFIVSMKLTYCLHSPWDMNRGVLPNESWCRGSAPGNEFPWKGNLNELPKLSSSWQKLFLPKYAATCKAEIDIVIHSSMLWSIRVQDLFLSSFELVLAKNSRVHEKMMNEI